MISSSGIASIIIFHAFTIPKLVDEENDDVDVALTKVTKQVTKKIKAIPTVRFHYETE